MSIKQLKGIELEMERLNKVFDQMSIGLILWVLLVIVMAIGTELNTITNGILEKVVIVLSLILLIAMSKNRDKRRKLKMLKQKLPMIEK